MLDSAEDAVRNADVIMCATNSASPVIETEWLKPGVHVSSMGPKFVNRHELPLDISSVCGLIFTDSLPQITAYPEPFFLHDTERIIGLEEVVAGEVALRGKEDEVTLFCSVGLAGTEVLLAAELFRRVKPLG